MCTSINMYASWPLAFITCHLQTFGHAVNQFPKVIQTHFLDHNFHNLMQEAPDGWCWLFNQLLHDMPVVLGGILVWCLTTPKSQYYGQQTICWPFMPCDMGHNHAWTHCSCGCSRNWGNGHPKHWCNGLHLSFVFLAGNTTLLCQHNHWNKPKPQRIKDVCQLGQCRQGRSSLQLMDVSPLQDD